MGIGKRPGRGQAKRSGGGCKQSHEIIHPLLVIMVQV
jgi:hypothetical protein